MSIFREIEENFHNGKHFSHFHVPICSFGKYTFLQTTARPDIPTASTVSTTTTSVTSPTTSSDNSSTLAASATTTKETTTARPDTPTASTVSTTTTSVTSPTTSSDNSSTLATSATTTKETVAVENSAGIGVPSLNTTRVQSGAPLMLVEETDSNLLIRPSPVEVPDKERQISVQLPLHDLLCNLFNGQPIRWGVIVVQDGNQNDVPFTGTLQGFKSRRLSVYKRCSQVKDDDSIPAYVATPLDWSPRCSPIVIGNRQNRSTDLAHVMPYKDFVVGSQGECSGVPDDQYCNGELQPGRSYRVKAFVCNSKGCTETRYSNPISTDPDLTIPIVAEASSAIVVLVVVVVIVCILKRKQMVCFAKDSERSPHTHRPDDDIHLDKIEPTKKNPFRPGPIKLSDFQDTVDKLHRDSDLLFADAYKLLKEKSPNHRRAAAEQQCCRPKNRYTNILAFDHSRVKLRPTVDMEGSDYINANYIPGYTSRREYIATQGPMQATFDDFWRMIWEQNVDTIVMLTKLMEEGRQKCDKYWPNLGEHVCYGDLVVSLQSESNLSDYTIKILEVKKKEERKMVRHFSYLKWPDMGCPETPKLLLEFVKAVRQYINREKRTTSGPTVVHCSSGVGRTGTFIAVDYLLQHIRDHDDVDIFSLVLEMRNHRLNMVQTEDQYVYIHDCLKSFITTITEEDENGDKHVYVNA
ncbi:tyrosine-protein phosphatase 10D-like [Mercenaria mercenaria]|uniref:tyrosine-protein phosphatase 10D-like n=1 Tax=Mercenaria mercenaria TaxID=6596 RepID=UPI00234F017D|nr:tyrosine-protein phosphatase 10D-like [Mercenaria mercenaria]